MTEILIALVNATPGSEAEFDDWYTTVHLPEVVALPGFVSAQRYQAPEALAGSLPYRNATVYQLEIPAAQALGLLYTSPLGSSPTLDTQQIIMGGYAPLGAPITP